MIVVHFFEKNVELLNQLLDDVPAEGEQVKIKGRKGTVLSVNQINEKHVHVLVELELVKKQNLLVNDPKKKRR